MNLDCVEHDGVTLVKLTNEDYDDVIRALELIEVEGDQHGIYFSRVADKKLLFKRGIEWRAKYLLTHHIGEETRNNLHIWKLSIDEEFVGYFSLNHFLAPTFIHFALLEDHQDPESMADIVDRTLGASIDILGDFFDHHRLYDHIWIFCFAEYAEDIEGVVTRHGFDPCDTLDFIDYGKQASFVLDRRTFDIYHRGASYK
jgi:hypothetical protein